MKKIGLFSVMLLVLVLLGTNLSYAKSDEVPIVEITPNKVTALADGNDEIKIKVYEYSISCYNASANYTSWTDSLSECTDKSGTPEILPFTSTAQPMIRVTVSGTGNVYTPADEFRFTDPSGVFYISIKSTVAEEKTVTISSGSSWSKQSKINFASSTSSPSTTPQKPTTTAPAASATPIAPTFSLSNTAKVTSTGTSQPVTAGSAPSITTNQKIAFSGTATANAKVTLTIKSDPIVKEVTAGVDGKWSYTLDPKELALETGNHTVSAYATDTKGVKSTELELAKFELKDAPAPVAAPEPYRFKIKDLLTPLTPLNYAFVGGALVLIGVLIYLILRRRKQTSAGVLNIEERR